MTPQQADVMRRLLELVRHYAEPAASGTGQMHDYCQRAIQDAQQALNTHDKVTK